MRHPFTHDNIDFVIIVTQSADGYNVRTHFLGGKPANHRSSYISFEESDSFKRQYGYPGVEQLIRDEQAYVEAGNYYGSPSFEFNSPSL